VKRAPRPGLAPLAALCLALVAGCGASSPLLDPSAAAAMADANRQAAGALDRSSRALEGAYGRALANAVAPCRGEGPDAWPAEAACAAKAAAPVDARYAPVDAALRALVAAQHRVADAVGVYVACLKGADAVCAARALEAYANAWADVAPALPKGAAK
jgi:hypothetical protein